MFVFYARANVWFGSCELLREVNCVQKLKEAERKRMNELEEFDKKANVQINFGSLFVYCRTSVCPLYTAGILYLIDSEIFSCCGSWKKQH